MSDFNWDMMGNYRPEPEPQVGYKPIVNEPLNLKLLRTAIAKEFYRKFDPPQPESNNAPPPLSPQQMQMMQMQQQGDPYGQQMMPF